MIKGGQRIATATGVMLADPYGLGNPPLRIDEALFDPAFWSARGELAAVSSGRGSAWFIGGAAEPWVLKAYRRGGFIARISQDRYLWTGEDRVRAFAEWRLLSYLRDEGLNVPSPVAAFYRRVGCTYRCDLITRRIAQAESLSSTLAAGPVAEDTWRAVGREIARLHRHGVDHADLNAHNVLLGEDAISVIDFDRGRLRRPGTWQSRNLARLRRSLLKIAAGLPPERFTAESWKYLLSGYEAS